MSDVETLLALLAGWLVACAVHLALSRDLFRTVLGMMLMTTAANLALLVLGRVRSAAPPFVPDGADRIALDEITNPLPQAFVLTSIVIGLAIFAFVLALLVPVARKLGTLDVDALRASEPSDDASRPRVSSAGGDPGGGEKAEDA